MTSDTASSERDVALSSLGRNGVQDWLVQRAGALVLLAYGLFMVIFFLCHPKLGYTEWHQLFASTLFRAFSVLALLALASHAWIGLWAVINDYFVPHMMGAKSRALRLLAQAAVLLLICLYLGIGALAVFH